MRFVFQAALIDILDVPSEEAKRRFLVIYIAQQFNCVIFIFYFFSIVLSLKFFSFFLFRVLSFSSFFLFFFFTYINSNIAALSVSCVGRALAFVLL